MRGERRPILTVGPDEADVPGFGQKSIQAALDHVAHLGGGTVQLLAGRYLLRNAVRLRSGVRLEGVGDDTWLVKAPEVGTELTADVDWYQAVAEVADSRGFEVGDGVVLQGQDPHGKPQGRHRIKRTVVAIEDHRLYFDQRVTENFWITHENTISTLFPLVWGEEVEEVEVASLRLDGNREHNGLLDGNHAGCIFLQYVRGAVIEGVTCHDMHGDGISWQVADDVHVIDCHLFDNANLGLHPGSGSLRPVMRGNRSHGNDIGLFFCWGVQHGLAEDNRLEDNRSYGVSIGHRDSDNLVRGNTIARNAKVGIYFRPEEPSARLPHRNVFEGNDIVDNGAADEGVGLWLRDKVEGTVVRLNRFADTGGGVQQVAIRIDAEVPEVTLADNRFEGIATEVDDRR